MTYWQVALGLSAIAAIFILWPLLSHWLHKDERQLAEDRVAANTRLYEEHLAELQQLLDNGDIGEDEFATLKLEQQRALLEDATDYRGARYRRDGMVLVVVTAVLVPAFAWIAYQQLGAKDDWHIYELVQSIQKGEAQSADVERELRSELARRVKQRPDNVQNWYLLASLALNVRDYDQAVAAFRQMLAVDPGSPHIMAELAQALFLQAGNRVTAEVRHITEAALEIEPDMPTALGLAGIDAFQQGYFQEAINHWTHAVELLGAEAPGSQSLLSGIERAKAELKAGGKVATEGATGSADDENAIRVKVSLADGVTADPASTVFVYARAFKGSPMPLAIQRFKVSELPKDLKLDDSMSMAPGMTLSKFEELEIIARISATGDAVPQAGDWQVIRGPVSLADTDAESALALVISEQIP